jgi:hypothetical protein
MRQHGASNRVPQQLAGRTRQQRRAETPGAIVPMAQIASYLLEK